MSKCVWRGEGQRKVVCAYARETGYLAVSPSPAPVKAGGHLATTPGQRSSPAAMAPSAKIGIDSL